MQCFLNRGSHTQSNPESLIPFNCSTVCHLQFRVALRHLLQLLNYIYVWKEGQICQLKFVKEIEYSRFKKETRVHSPPGIPKVFSRGRHSARREYV